MQRLGIWEPKKRNFGLGGNFLFCWIVTKPSVFIVGYVAGYVAGYGRAMGGLWAGPVRALCFRACRGKKEGRIHPHPTPHSPRTHHATCPALCIPKVEGMECVGGPVRAKKRADVPQRGGFPLTPPHVILIGELAWDGLCARKIGCFRSTIRRPGHLCPAQ